MLFYTKIEVLGLSNVKMINRFRVENVDEIHNI
jgi:hypothetical protein